MNGVSREYFDFVRQHVERSMDSSGAVELLTTAVQTGLVRDTIPQQ